MGLPGGGVPRLPGGPPQGQMWGSSPPHMPPAGELHLSLCLNVSACVVACLTCVITQLHLLAQPAVFESHSWGGAASHGFISLARERGEGLKQYLMATRR